MAKEITSDVSVGKKKVGKYILVGIGILLLLVLGILSLTGKFTPKINPLAQFTTDRTCSFLVMDNVSKAVCSDGTAWDVTQIGSPAPLP